MKLATGLRKVSAVAVFLSFFPALFSQCIKGNCQNGEGEFLRADGSKYKGSFLDGKFDGYGMIIFPNQDTASGYFWQDSLYTGRYTFADPYYPTRSTYTGSLRAYIPWGKGRLENAFHVYQGEFREGLPCGQGADTIYFGNLKIYKGTFQLGFLVKGFRLEFDSKMHSTKYEGEFYKFQPHGTASYYIENDLVYQGEFFEGQYQGKGKLFQKGFLEYEGGFFQGKPEGQGTLYQYISGNVLRSITGNFDDAAYSGPVKVMEDGKLLYEGDFPGDVRSGFGISYTPSGIRQYEGNWTNGTATGLGKLYLNSYILEGNFEDMMLSGPGKKYGPENRLIYEGDFASNLYEGKGKEYDSLEVLVYEGEFKSGQRSGQGILYLAKGDIFEGEFSAGLPVSGTYQKKGKGKKKPVVYIEGKFKKG